MRYLITAMLTVVGMIHLLPLAGVLGAARLEALYGVAVDGSDLEILLRHRAVLFGLLGAFLVVAALPPRVASGGGARRLRQRGVLPGARVVRGELQRRDRARRRGRRGGAGLPRPGRLRARAAPALRSALASSAEANASA
jgi:hypothetical protein